MAPYEQIEGYGDIIRAFGYWPKFHDSEVRYVRLDRSEVLCDEMADAQIEICLHAFEWTKEEKPAFNHHLVVLRFSGICDLVLEGFNHQNAILELKIECPIGCPDATACFKVTFVQAHGLSGSFCAACGQVISVGPCDEKGFPK